MLYVECISEVLNFQLGFLLVKLYAFEFKLVNDCMCFGMSFNRVKMLQEEFCYGSNCCMYSFVLAES